MKKDTKYYILAGTDNFEDELIAALQDAEIEINSLHLTKIGYHTKIGKLLRKYIC